MLKRYAALSLVIVALCLIPLLASAQADRALPSNAVPVTIQSRPDIAEVVVDGAFVGTTPLHYRLTPGVHRIEMSRRSFQSWSRDLSVIPETPTSVTALLEQSDVKPCPAK